MSRDFHLNNMILRGEKRLNKCIWASFNSASGIFIKTEQTAIQFAFASYNKLLAIPGLSRVTNHKVTKSLRLGRSS